MGKRISLNGFEISESGKRKVTEGQKGFREGRLVGLTIALSIVQEEKYAWEGNADVTALMMRKALEKAEERIRLRISYAST